MINIFKVLIADDEPKIRNGLHEAINWADLNMAVIGLAKDGEDALNIAQRENPDICLVDICMPYVNGLEMIEKLKEKNPKVLAIVITGYDEFEFAQKAVKLKAFDYILKPINEEELLKVLEKAEKELTELAEKEKRFEWANSQLRKSMPILREKFVIDWLEGLLHIREVEEQLEFHELNLRNDLGIILVKTQGITLTCKARVEWEKQLLLFAIQNVFEEMLEPLKPFAPARNPDDNLVAVATVKDRKAWEGFKFIFEDNIEKYLDHKVSAYMQVVEDGMEGVPAAYEEIRKTMRSDSQYLPIIKKVKSYIERNYHSQNLTLQSVSEEMGISACYLSKLFKQETGMSFIDYLIKIRIMESIKLMNDPTIKVYEIADRVGYSSQHYFCAAFKKILGVSPTEYRQKEH